MPTEPLPPGTEPYRHWTTAGDHVIHARVRTDLAPPDRLPTVLVHGQVVASRYLVPTLRHLAPHVPVYAPDLPGYGESSKPDDVLDVDDLGDAVVGWMDAVGIPKAALLGNSFGCQIIAAAASRHPDRVDRAVLQGPTLAPDARSLPKALWRGIITARREPPMGNIMVDDYRKAGFRRSAGTMWLVLHDHIERRLPHMPMPTLVVRGGSDVLVPEDWAEDLVRLLPQGQLVTIPDVEHTLVHHHAKALVERVLPFLDQRAPSPQEVPA